MILESKNGMSLDYGTMTVSGDGEIKIPTRGRPLEVQVSFSDPPPPPPVCGPAIDDEVEIEIEHFAHPFPLWVVKISWEIHSGGAREIYWQATAVR